MHPDDKELTEAMRKVADRLASARWAEQTYVSQPRMRVEFSPAGREGLRELGRIFALIGWPDSVAELMCLHSLSRQAEA